MKISILVFLFSIASQAATEKQTEKQDFELAGIKKVEVRNKSGMTQIAGVSEGKASISANKKVWSDKCSLTMTKDESTLQVRVEEKGFVSTGKCEVDLSIKAPKDASLDIVQGSGDISVDETEGALKYTLGSGSVKANGAIKKVNGKSGSGSVELKGLMEGGDIITGSGDLRLTYTKVPTVGELDIKTGSGKAEILMPKGAKIRTSYVSGSGDMINELGDSPNSQFKVKVKAGAGDLHIKKM